MEEEEQEEEEEEEEEKEKEGEQATHRNVSRETGRIRCLFPALFFDHPTKLRRHRIATEEIPNHRQSTQRQPHRSQGGNG